jgi:CheY-like chemotaxis protein
MVLEKHGLTVVAKRELDNLVADVERIDPDVILLDVMFPENPQAGFEAARAIRAEQKIKHIPILIVSAVNQMSPVGFSDRDISDNFMPVQGFVEKPIKPTTLVARINELLAPPKKG